MKSATALPPLKPCSSAQEVVDEHLDALNQGDWERAMAQYPPNVEIFLPGGQVVQGREKVGELFEGFLKPRTEGGLGGIKFDVVHSFPVNDTITVVWRITADFLAEPYLGTDAYITKDGLMWAQVSTLRLDDLKFK
jgi:hypothetical protein